MERYLGMDVHADSCTICALCASGKQSSRAVVETRAPALVEYFRSLTGRVHLCIEETEWSDWLVEILAPHVAEIVSVPGLRVRGSKNDQVDAHALAERLRTGQIRQSVYKAPRQFARLRELARVYRLVVGDVVRTKNRLRSLFRRRGVSCTGEELYEAASREGLLERLPETLHTAVELLGLELDSLQALRQAAESAMVEEAHRVPISRILETVPGLGPIRVAQLMPIVITPYRFRTKRQFWAYCGFGITTESSSDWVPADGGWTKAPVTRTRGLNRNSNRTLKTIFTGAAQSVITHGKTTPLRETYERLVASGTKPNMARLTLARKIAAITLALWKSKERFDPARLNG